MLSKRVYAALVFVPLVLILIYFGGWSYNLFITAVLLVASYEFSRVFRKLGYHPVTSVVLGGVLLFSIQRWLLDETHLGILISAIIFVTVLTALIQYESGEDHAAFNFTITLSGILYIGWVGSYLILLRGVENGRGWLLTALPATWLADSGAYFVGSWLGKNKMAPRLSPHKTWAGFLGGVIWGTLSGLLLVLLWRTVGFLPENTPLWQGALMGLILAFLTPMGDLIISLFKRTANLKDTSNFIPGHGGVLDRIDTWIWGAMLGYYIVMLLW